MFSSDSIYVQIYTGYFIVQNMDSGAVAQIQRDQKFASPRMLIADFTMAEHQLRQAIKEVRRGLFKPNILMHPRELIDGGITQVEYRVFTELGLGSGAVKVGTWSGPVLNDVESVRKAIRDYKH
ncbi:hypothetical protein [Collimonas pratensis]|uniref:hypothetical protein n=1 Tax=Collimonas pratensis TaxID=279113 RepID=UPI0007859162|nr:hypothetical protein [Collimonas pratensis]